MKDFAIVAEREMEGVKVLSIDKKQAKYKGSDWKDLSDYGKRKFEILIKLSRNGERVKFHYV